MWRERPAEPGTSGRTPGTDALSGPRRSDGVKGNIGVDWNTHKYVCAYIFCIT